MSRPASPDFLASELGLNHSPDTALFHVIPVPLERSVSYGRGTEDGPAAILEASQQLESWDGRSTPVDLGIHTTAFIDCSGEIEQVLQRIRNQTAVALESGKIPVLLGGEHTITVGALEAVRGFFPEPVGVFQLDAHADLRESYEESRLSHACAARRVHADLGMELFQFGVRAISLEEWKYREKHGIPHLDAATFYQSASKECSLPSAFPERIYLTLDSTVSTHRSSAPPAPRFQGARAGTKPLRS